MIILLHLVVPADTGNVQVSAQRVNPSLHLNVSGILDINLS